MSVDLKNNSLMRRSSLVLMDDCLIKLEHAHTQDRVRKIMFDRIESVLIWRTTPWLRIVLVAIFLGLPFSGFLFIGETVTTVIGIFLLACVGIGVIYYLYCRQTTIRIVRAGQTHDITGIFRPGRLWSFRNRLIAKIRATQQMASPQAFIPLAITDTVLQSPLPPLPPSPSEIPIAPAPES